MIASMVMEFVQCMALLSVQREVERALTLNHDMEHPLSCQASGMTSHSCHDVMLMSC